MELQAHRAFAEVPFGAVLDRLSVGVVLLNEREQISFANARAQALLQAGAQISTADGRFLVWQPQRKAFERLLAGALDGRPDLPPLPLGAYDDEQRTILLLEPLTAAPRGPATQRLAIAWIADSRDAEPGCEWLASLYQLTPAERNVTANLASGLSTVDVARKLSISVATLRTHLRRIFGKTGCQNQAALVRMAHLFPIAHAPGFEQVARVAS